MPQNDPQDLLKKFCECVWDVAIADDEKAEIVINLAKAWSIDDHAIKQALFSRIGPDAAEHPYFHWQPRPRYHVGETVRVIDGAPQALGQSGRVTAIDSPKRLGVRGMARNFFYTVVLDMSPEPWGFREEQLESFGR